ncbi:hypothetical protein PHLGIDRAFT_209272 [Phlebiopsis gigantea 11061_1 CR5-6]|uniref:Uncharacterized protein n=1 Tax=Phlebiopsis gigantea (strain 11061_1 CR5-6) TaxID=745531 RepID=A0A0C3SEP0_PHLG1|nr:hypothetical protein PHLGIDRAFT_209272 [Phlebiopsis gigantea 11061_1 CR5-6]
MRRRRHVSTDHRQLRLLIQGDIAFVFSPITLESFTPRKSYMVTWMTPESTATIQQMIWGTSDTDAQTELHTFIDCPSEEETEAWYYVGKLRWSASHLAPQWPKSIKQIKENLTEAVVQRWRSSHLRAKDIGAIIEQGRFEQFEVELGFDSTLGTASMKMRKELD